MKKRNERDSYLDEKDSIRSPTKLPSRDSSTFRTGNSITVKFNPPKSSDAPDPPRSALRRTEEFTIAAAPKPKKKKKTKKLSQTITPEVDQHYSIPRTLSPTYFY
jgi:hypothetical protein